MGAAGERTVWTRRRVAIWAGVVLGAAVLAALLASEPGARATGWLGRQVRWRMGWVKVDFEAAEQRWRERLGDGADELAAETSIVIRKGERRLELRRDGELIAEYAIALSRHSTGHKTARGDGCTPEGDYVICTRLPESSYHLFMGINYPNAEDARAALEAGRIDEATCRELEEAASTGAKPDWETALGGAIGIHGGGTDGDWTLGCIAVADEAIEDLWVATRMGTPVRIEP